MWDYINGVQPMQPWHGEVHTSAVSLWGVFAVLLFCPEINTWENSAVHQQLHSPDNWADIVFMPFPDDVSWEPSYHPAQSFQTAQKFSVRSSTAAPNVICFLIFATINLVWPLVFFTSFQQLFNLEISWVGNNFLSDLSVLIISNLVFAKFLLEF